METIYLVMQSQCKTNAKQHCPPQNFSTILVEKQRKSWEKAYKQNKLFWFLFVWKLPWNRLARPVVLSYINKQLYLVVSKAL